MSNDNPFFSLVPDAPSGANTADSDGNPFPALIDAEIKQRREKANTVLELVLPRNPDKEAEAKRLGATFGLDPDTVSRNHDELARIARVRDIQRMTAASPVLARQLANPDFAALAHDNVENMAAMERTFLGTLGDVGVTAVKGAIGLPRAFVGLANIPTFGYVGKGLDAIGVRFNDAQAIASGWYSPAQQRANREVQAADGFVDTLGAALSNPSTIATTVGESLPQMLGGAGIARGLMKFLPKVSPLLAGAAGEGIIGAGSAAESIRAQTPDELLDLKQSVSALGSGAMTAVFGLMGGKLTQRLGIDDIDTALARGNLDKGAAETAKRGFVARLAGGGISEGLFEELPQSAQEQMWQNFATGRPIGEGVENAMAMGLLAGTTMGGGFQAVRYLADRQNAQRAEKGTEFLDNLNKLAAADKVLARDPETFQQWVAQVSEGSPVQQVFIDAKALMQSGLGGELAKVSPAVAAQIDAAVVSGGQIAIPVEEYAARIAPTEYAQSLLDHLKVEPEGFSRAEAQQFMQSHAEALQQEVERALTEKQVDDTFKASAEAVKAQLLADLNTLGRFTPAKNEADATLFASYYAVRAAQMGTTPEELFARRPVRFNAEKVGAGETAVFGQALASQPPKGWKHSVDGADASALWEGQEGTEAVFWTDLQGKLAQDAPAVAGYSHSVNRSAVTHIRKQHGDAATEAERGQLPVTAGDLARIPEIVTSYDAIRTDLQGDGGAPEVAFSKRVSDGVLVYLARVSHKRSNLSAVSMWKFPPETDAATVLNHAVKEKAPRDAGPGNALRPLSDYESDAQAPLPDSILGPNGQEFNQGDQARGSFNPETFTVTLLKGADLSTALHEGAHFFFENDLALAAELAQEAEIFGLDALKPGERQILADVSALLNWHGIQGEIGTQLAQWYNLDFEEKRAYHERTAESFEAYLFEGKAPSLELQPYFQKFRAWLLNVYRSLKDFVAGHPEAGKLNDEVRGVFDRLLATNEQITLAEQGRSMMPLFTSPEQAGMTPEEFAAYQALGVNATAEAIEDLQARGLRDMRWLHNARGRIIQQLQKEAEAQRAEVQIEVHREVMSQPIYRAWQFLTGKLTADDKIAPPAKRTSSPDSIDETQDSLFAAIAKLGGLNRAAVQSEWGIDPKEHIPMPAFGKHVLRREGGLSIDAMGEALGQYGYLTLDEHGKHDLRQLEDKFFEELRGNTQYSIAYDYAADMETRAGDQVVNPQALGAGRFDLGELKVMGLPAEVINAVQARRMTAGNGLHPDIVAEMFGFTSGDELVRKLAEVETPSAKIEALTDVRMLEQFGDLASPEAIEKAADKAIHNDARARFVATEANALAKATGQRKVLASAAKEFARAMIARLKVRDIKPGQYANAEVRAAKAAEQASKAGDLATAAAEKRNQLIQNYATRAAYDAQEEVDKGLRYLKKFEGDIKTLDVDYADQIGNLLERFDLRKGQSNKAVDKRTALAEWIKAQREAGREPDIPPELENEAFRTSYKNLTVEEFRGLVDTVRQIEHMGRSKHKLLTAAGQRTYEAVRDEIAGSIRENAQGRQADTRTPTTNMGRTIQGIKRFWASHIKAATWARILDGNKDGGPVWEYFVRSANESGDRETTMRAEATAKLSEILAPVFKLGRMGGGGQYFEGVATAADRRRGKTGSSFNRQQRLAIALNTGNAGNLQRLLGGEGWTMAQITPVLQSLTAQEWAAVQAVWDHFESYRPQIAEKERRVYGKEPEWVEPQPFAVTTADGATVMLRGGYYPIQYDPAASQRAEEHADAEDAQRQLQGAYTTATTRRSFTKARVEEVQGRPLLYTLAGVYSGVNDVIHDLAWHEWLIDANRLLRSHTIDAAIREHYGPEAKQQFKTWVQDVAEGDRGAANAGEALLGRLRQGVSAAGLGFNVMSAAIQITGFTQSIVRVGAPWIGRGIAKYLSNPVGLTRTVNGMSSFMENRARTHFRELNELRNQVQDQSAFNEFIGRYAYFMMMRVQQVVDVPTWWGAYEKAIAAGNEEPRAVALADQAVIDAQGGGQTKDLSAIERGGPALRLFTVFYSFMNTALNLGAAQTMGANTPAKRAKLAVYYYPMLYTVPVVLGFALTAALTPGDSGDDDLEEIAKKLAAEQLSYLMGLMVVVREFGEVAKIVTGNPSFGYQGPAGVRVFSDAQKFGQQAMQGEFDEAFYKSAVNLIGALTGLPAAQVNRTMTGAKALAEGETENPAAVAFGFQEPR